MSVVFNVFNKNLHNVSGVAPSFLLTSLHTFLIFIFGATDSDRHLIQNPLKVSVAAQLMTSVLWDVARPRLVICYQRSLECLTLGDATETSSRKVGNKLLSDISEEQIPLIMLVVV